MSDADVTLQRSFPASPRAPAMARDAIRAFLRGSGADPGALSDVLLAVSEVVTNCVIHAYRGGQGDVAMEARQSGGLLTLRVADRGDGMRPRLDSPGLGLGLPLVGRIARRVDISSPAEGGTEVRMCFELDRRST